MEQISILIKRNYAGIMSLDVDHEKLSYFDSVLDEIKKQKITLHFEQLNALLEAKRIFDLIAFVANQ